jgi:hypothetical protein
MLTTRNGNAVTTGLVSATDSSSCTLYYVVEWIMWKTQLRTLPFQRILKIKRYYTVVKSNVRMSVDSWHRVHKDMNWSAFCHECPPYSVSIKSSSIDARYRQSVHFGIYPPHARSSTVECCTSSSWPALLHERMNKVRWLDYQTILINPLFITSAMS